MEDIAVLALVMATLGQVALCATILLTRSIRTPAYLPLAVFFIAGGIITAGPAFAIFLPTLQTHLISITLPAYLLLGPALWLYVEGLTSETHWRLERRHSKHLAIFGLGLVATGLIISLPMEVRAAMFIYGTEEEVLAGAAGSKKIFPFIVAGYVFLLILGWIAQSGYYVIRVFRRLSRYRQRLKTLFASNEQRELHWLGWLVLVIGCVWLLSFAMIISDNFFGYPLLSRRFGAAMALILIWSLGLWGLRQKPGFEGRYLDLEPEALAAETADATSEQKYQRSALGDEQASRIAEKINAAMDRDQLYLDPALSLHKLAKHIAVSPNYISQTLNETIGTSFFDYVNKWRISAAKPQIASGNETVLTIAIGVGFNARSSFYKTFKRETGLTPSEFRKTYSVE